MRTQVHASQPVRQDTALSRILMENTTAGHAHRRAIHVLYHRQLAHPARTLISSTPQPA